MDDTAYILGYETGVEAGRLEVIEWILEYGRTIYDHNHGEVAFNHVAWHTKLKEWGIV